jgi:hypothetical protein
MVPVTSVVVAMTLGLGACASPGPSATAGVTANASIPPGADLGVPAPARSGVGRRIVWSKSRNHVWLMSGTSQVLREYAVTDLDWKTPTGTFRVMYKARRSYASDSKNGHQTLNYFVPFYRRCPSCSLIGFHAIPITDSGRQIQPDSALGTEQYASHGCIRQTAADARALYEFVGTGTKVVVVK